MMMSKPAPTTQEEAPPAFAQPPIMTTKAPQQSDVEDLERKLAMLGEQVDDMKPPAVPTPAVAAPPAQQQQRPAASTQGGKNALLARIMAAKEKSQQAQTKTAPKQEAPDLLMDFDAPSTEKDPPPSYNTNFLQPPPATAAPPAVQDAPPAFDAVENSVIQQAFPPPPPIESVQPPPAMPPPPAMMMAPPAASAPSFESLMVHEEPQQPVQAMPPPAAPPAIDEDILAALDPAEREALLEEQRQIMEQIEKNKANNEASGAAARAMAFNQRSSAAVANLAASMDGPTRASMPPPAAAASSRNQTRSSGGNTVDLGHGETVPLHGQERTQQAIKDGTAVIVQCMSCKNWMQVTEAASLMFCPICQVVCPVEKAGAATSADMEAAAQLAADQKLAEELQKEEYKKAGGGGGGGERRRQQQRAKPKPAAASSEQSWYDWLTGAPAPAATPAAAAPSSRSAEIRGPRLVAAQTGEETQGLIQNTSVGGGARVAEQKSMFACVADSVTAAAGQMTALTLTEDPEGNVHGVDSSSLLAMPEVSRQRD